MKKIILLLIGCLFFAVSAQAVYTVRPMAGVHQEFRDDGTLWKETPYKNGKLEGIKKIYYENGNLMEEVNFSQGKAVSGYMYDYEGNRTKMTNAHLHNLNKEINSFQ